MTNTTVSFPQTRRIRPSVLATSEVAEALEPPGTPFGLAYWQVLAEERVAILAASIATDIGADANARLAVEAPLRWHVSARDTSHREPVVLAHSRLTGDEYLASDDALDRERIGGGVLLIAACEIVTSTEACATYRQTLGGEPIGAAMSTLVVGNERPPPLPADAIKHLSPTEARRRRALLAVYPDAAGESLFAAAHTAYPTTLDTLAAAAPPPPPPPSPDSDDETPLAALDAARPAPPPPRSEPVRVASESALTAWHRSVLSERRYRIDVILRGYVSVETVRAARRLCSAAGDPHYVVMPSAVYSSAAAALASAPPAPAPMPEPMAVDEPPPVRRRHLLDRLTTLGRGSLSRLTYYEVDRAARDRLSVHLLLFSQASLGSELQRRAYVCTYPRGRGAPVLQPYADAPGLLGEADAHDYAAIGLAALCLVARSSESLRSWLLNAEAYFYQLRVGAEHLVEYLARIEAQIDGSRLPREGALDGLVREIAETARQSIADIDLEAAAAPEVEEEPMDRGGTPPPEDVASSL